MADIFQEVDEEVRRERLIKLWQQYGNLIIALCILIVAAVGGWRGYEWWQNRKAAESGAAFEAAVRLAEAGKHQESEAAFAKLAADRNAGQVIQDLAALRSGFLLVDTAPYSEIRQRLEPQTAADKPFRHSARELLALSAWKSGDMAAAKQWATMIITDPLTPQGTRSRAEVLTELIASSGKG